MKTGQSGQRRSRATSDPRVLLELGGIAVEDIARGDNPDGTSGIGVERARWGLRFPSLEMDLAWRDRPAFARAHAGRILYTGLSADLHVVPRGRVSGALPAFLGLWAKPDAAVARVAQEFGVFRLCNGCGGFRWRPRENAAASTGETSHKLCKQPKAIQSRRRLTPTGPRGDYQSEPIAPWRAWSLRFYALTLLVAHLRLVDVGRPHTSPVIVKVPEGARHLGARELAALVNGGLVPGNVEPADLWYFVEATLAQWQTIGGAALALVIDPHAPAATRTRRQLDCPTLFAVLVEQLVRLVHGANETEAPRIAVCSRPGCGRDVTSYARKPGSRRWCDDPRCRTWGDTLRKREKRNEPRAGAKTPRPR